jgi:hypothetical protein
MFNIVRTGSGVVLGIASGILNPLGPVKSTIVISTTPSLILGFDTVAEIAGTVIGGGLQMLAPTTLPNMADGLVECGLALLARRTAEYITKAGQTPPPPYFSQPYARVGAANYGQVHSPTAGGMGRPVQSSFTGLPTYRVG